jgi:hypothetical protein
VRGGYKSEIGEEWGRKKRGEERKEGEGRGEEWEIKSEECGRRGEAMWEREGGRAVADLEFSKGGFFLEKHAHSPLFT